MKTSFYINTNDSIKLFVNRYTPEISAKKVLIIVHGMAEHSLRYEAFAEFLNKSQVVVYSYDQRGHGKTAERIEEIGFFAENDGIKKVTDDLDVIVNYVKNEYVNLPVILLGHSMGSFVVRNYAAIYGNSVSGIILSGTGGSAGFEGKAGFFLTKILCKIKNKKSPSKLMDKLIFGTYNKKINPQRTKFDWLSRNELEVDKYINDSFCGTVFSVGFFKDLIQLVEIVNKKNHADKIPKELPIYLFSGSNDPLSKYGKQIEDVYNLYKNSGTKNITMKLYKDGRHEMLNEINKDSVYNDIITWIEKYS